MARPLEGPAYSWASVERQLKLVDRKGKDEHVEGLKEALQAAPPQVSGLGGGGRARRPVALCPAPIGPAQAPMLLLGRRRCGKPQSGCWPSWVMSSPCTVPSAGCRACCG